MVQTLKRAIALVVILAAVGAATIWFVSNPYQRDRLLIELGFRAG